MKRLAIIRHAKTEQQRYDHDFDRELVDLGVSNAKGIADELKGKGIRPDKIISSPAKRAVTTARLFAEGLGFPIEKIVEEKGLYFDFNIQDFWDMVHETGNGVETLFIVGHNPFMHYVAQNVCPGYDGHMPTCSTVVVDFDVDSWQEAGPRQGVLFQHFYPKNN